jgi:hypothetical protein
MCTFINFEFSFKNQERVDKTFFMKQQYWAPDASVKAKKIPTWASNMDHIRKVHATFELCYAKGQLKQKKISTAKVQEGLKHLAVLEQKFKEFLPKK